MAKKKTDSAAPRKMVLQLLPGGEQWHEYIPGVELLLAPLTRSSMLYALRASKGDDAAYQDHINGAVLLDWKGLCGHDGEALPVTPESRRLVRANVPLGEFIDARISGYLLKEAEEIKN